MAILDAATFLFRAVRALAGVCDGARRHDDVGFNGVDTHFGHEMAHVPPTAWTPGQVRAVHTMIYKYRNQLLGHGIDMDACPEIPSVEGMRVLAYNDKYRNFQATWEYKDKDMEEIKSFVKAGKGFWARDEKCWVVRDITLARELMSRYGFRAADEQTGDVLAEGIPERKQEAPTAKASSPNERRATREGSELVLSFPFDRELVDAIKALNGRKWDPERKVWKVTLDSRNVEATLGILRGHGFHGDSATVAWARGIKDAEERNVELSQAMEGDANIDQTGLGGKLREFQIPAVQLMVENKRVLVGDEMGLGKTIEALAAIHTAKAYPAVIVCPAVVKGNWEREARKWLPGRVVTVLNGRKWTRQGTRCKTAEEALQGADVVVVNYDVLGRYTDALKALEPKAVVLDESHYAKNAKAARSKAAAELAKGVEYIWLLSGTPITNRPIELTHQLGILDKMSLFHDPVSGKRGWWGFVMRHCAAHREDVGRKVVWNMTGASHLDEMIHTLRAAGAYVGRKKTDALPGLPPKQHTIVRIAPTRVREYQAAIKSATELAAQAGPDNPSAALEAITSMRAAAMRAKLEGVRKWTEDFLASGQKLVVFAHHREAQRMLMDEFSDLNPAHIFGDDSAEERSANVDRFQNDPGCQLMVASLKAAGVGVTLTAASHAAFVELPWTYADLAQAEDRIHRIGQDESLESVNYYHLLIEDVGKVRNIDNYMAAVIGGKREIAEEASSKSPVQTLIDMLDAKQGDIEAEIEANIDGWLAARDERGY